MNLLKFDHFAFRDFHATVVSVDAIESIRVERVLDEFVVKFAFARDCSR